MFTQDKCKRISGFIAKVLDNEGQVLKAHKLMVKETGIFLERNVSAGVEIYDSDDEGSST